MIRKRIIAGNWKMNLTRVQALALAGQLAEISVSGDKEVRLYPPFLYLNEINKLVQRNESLSIGAQNCHHEEKGAFTGEISAEMLRSMHIRHVLVGHSERRMYFKETNEQLLAKLKLALNNDIQPVFCCGEPLEHREAGTHPHFIENQLSRALFLLDPKTVGQCVIAYEPIWAIGTGVTASKEQAQEMHAFIRSLVDQKFGTTIAENIQILYGGSVKPDNAADLFAMPDVDGGLVGGASLSAEQFIAIIHA